MLTRQWSNWLKVRWLLLGQRTTDEIRSVILIIIDNYLATSDLFHTTQNSIESPLKYLLQK